MDINRFIERSTAHDRDVDPSKLRELVRSAPSLSHAREEMREFVWNQSVADRIVQEIVLEDDTVDREDFAAQMPLVAPQTENAGLNGFKTGDLSFVGESRFTICIKSEKEIPRIVREVYEFIGLYDDGTVAACWKETDSMPIAEEKLDELETVIDAFPNTHTDASNAETRGRII